MNQNQIFIFTVFAFLTLLFLTKYYKLNTKLKQMEHILCKCTNTITKTSYYKNTYSYIYEYKYKGKTYEIEDKTKFKWPFFKPQIKEELDLFLNKQEIITPLKLYYLKIYKFGSFISLVCAILTLI